MKKNYFALMVLLCIGLVFTGCEKDEEIQPESTLTTTPAETDISGTSVDALQAYIDQLIEEGFSEEEVTLKLQEYINDQNDNTKSVYYTYTVSGVNIGSWMCESKSVFDRADWADSGYPYEPITNMWKDKVSANEQQAYARVHNHLEELGFDLSSIHSFYYFGLIDGTWKYNANYLATWSDDYWFNDNNHGRLFGSVKVGDYYVIIGAFSREAGGSHDFINFYEARNKAAGYSSYFPNSESCYSGNTWADGNSLVKVRIKN